MDFIGANFAANSPGVRASRFPIVLNHLSFSWPDGTVVLEDLSGAFNPGKTGLIGVNGAGKTTLLAIIAGLLTPSSPPSSLVVGGQVSYLPQTITMTKGHTVADLLGIGDKVRALRAIENGSVDQKDFDTIGSDWDIEDQAQQVLARLETTGGGLASLSLDREAVSLSGGEAMVVAIASCRLKGNPITLLDEPTNNLDSVLRQQVLAMISAWEGTLVVVSHDTGLLDLMDSTAELHGHSLRFFTGGYSTWKAAIDAEQKAALRAQTAAEQAVKVARRQRSASLERMDKNLSQGKRKAIDTGVSRLFRDGMKAKAEAWASRSKNTADDRLTQARENLSRAEAKVREEDHIVIDLPDPQVPSSKKILELEWPDGHFIMQGPDRVSLSGRNGEGKTSLIEKIMGLRSRDSQEEAATSQTSQAHQASSPYTSSLVAEIHSRLFTDRVGYLPQKMDGIDENLSTVDNVVKVAPRLATGEIRSRLARLLLRGDSVFRPVKTLSGGERFRAALAMLLLADPPAQLLILDEPTNNLDLPSVDNLVEALNSYRGSLLVVSHNQDFLHRIGVTTELELSGGRLSRKLAVDFVNGSE